jgi:ribosomal protein S27AE
VILGTTRKGRMSEHAARFMAARISQREGIRTELIDISSYSMEHSSRAPTNSWMSLSGWPKRCVTAANTFHWTLKREVEMAQEKEQMICSKCGAEMNHHADKLVEPQSTADTRYVNPALGGVIEETHGCPACGNVESRRAD